MLHAKGYSVSVTNAGIAGNGTQQMLARFDSAISGDARVVILDVGGGLWNNHRLGVDPAQGPADIAVMKAKLSARHIKIIDLHSSQGMPAAFFQPDARRSSSPRVAPPAVGGARARTAAAVRL
jgi:hypothetical protein